MHTEYVVPRSRSLDQAAAGRDFQAHLVHRDGDALFDAAPADAAVIPVIAKQAVYIQISVIPTWL